MTVRRELAASVLTDLLFEEPGVGRCLVAPDGTVLRANAEWLRSTGFSLDDVLGVDVIELFPGTRDMALAMHARARAGHRVEVPRHAQRMQGRETWWEGRITPVPMEGGMGLLITSREVGTAPDAHDGRASPLPSSPDVLQGIIEGTTDLIAALDRSFRFVAFNRAYADEFKKIFGRDIRVGDSMVDALAHLPRDQASAMEIWGRALSGETFTVVQEFGDDLRARNWYELRYSPIRGASGVIGAAHLVRDVTDRNRAEEALRRSEAALDAFFEASPGILNLVDEELRYLKTDAITPSYFGLTRPTIVGKSVSDLAPQFVETFGPMMRRVLETGEPRSNMEVHGTIPGKPGELTFWRASYFPVPLPGGRRGIGVMGLDVTDLKRAEEALRENVERRKRTEQELRQALERHEREVRLFDGVASTTPDFVYLFDVQGRFLYANRRLLEVWGMQLPDVIGKTCRELGYEQWHHDMHMREIAQVIETRRPIKGEVPFRAPVTGLFGVYEYIFTPVLGPHGEVEIIAGTTRDVTDRKEAEEKLREANARLVDADRRKDEFLGMLSHELRNPLAPIRNSAYVLRHAEPGSEQARRAQAVIERQTEHLARLVDDLLDVTRIARGKIELRRSRVDLRGVVSRAADDFRLLLHDRGVEFRVALPDASLWGEADPTRITQVVGNLLHNAAKFTRRGDEVTLSLQRAGGDAAEIRVRDTGAGIEPALLPRVFEPFVQGDRTLARTEGGLGLGLALVKGITELHGGTVRAESAGRDQGTEFIVRLPVVARSAAATPPGAGATSSNGRRRVLVVDDNVDAAESLADIVRMLGNDVEVAYDGPSALEKVRASTPDVILCDIGLPGMSGYEVASAIRANGLAEVRLVAVSGYAQPEDAKRSVEAGFDAHVAKPPDLGELSKLLADGG